MYNNHHCESMEAVNLTINKNTSKVEQNPINQTLGTIRKTMLYQPLASYIMTKPNMHSLITLYMYFQDLTDLDNGTRNIS